MVLRRNFDVNFTPNNGLWAAQFLWGWMLICPWYGWGNSGVPQMVGAQAAVGTRATPATPNKVPTTDTAFWDTIAADCPHLVEYANVECPDLFNFGMTSCFRQPTLKERIAVCTETVPGSQCHNAAESYLLTTARSQWCGDFDGECDKARYSAELQRRCEPLRKSCSRAMEYSHTPKARKAMFCGKGAPNRFQAITGMCHRIESLIMTR